MFRSRILCPVALLALGAGAATQANAQVTVTPTVTALLGGLYHYDYAIANATGMDVFDVDIVATPGDGNILNAMAPAGFTVTPDTGLGLVAFTEDTALFTATPTSGFAFDSPIAPAPGFFNAQIADSNGGIVTLTGATITPVPEPGALALVGAFLFGSGFVVRRRLRAAS